MKRSYRFEQGFTYELHVRGVADEQRAAFVEKRDDLDTSRVSRRSGDERQAGPAPRRDGGRAPLGDDHRHRRLGLAAQAHGGGPGHRAAPDLCDLTVVSYGGPDVGLLCATGKVKKVVCGFVTLDSIALDPHWRAARQKGQVEVMEVDEGMFFLGLQAAAWRVPFLPTRAGLGSDVLTINPGPAPGALPLRGRQPLRADPADADVELVAMPALHLDAAFVHPNRADTAGNGQILGPDPFFDALFLGAADRRFVTTERVVANGALTDEGPLSAVVIHRLLTDGVAETPGGAHFTANPPDYGRDEAFQKEYAASAGRRRRLGGLRPALRRRRARTSTRPTWPSGARRDAGRAA